jgi:hypothetical protein
MNKTELEKVIIQMGEILSYDYETIDNFDDDILENLSTILRLELDKRTKRVYN